MKIIFLDVDGVLNGTRKRDELLTRFTRFIFRKLHIRIHVYDMFGVRTCMVRRLSKIVKSTGAFVVLSSSWRNGYFKQNLSDRQLQLHKKLSRFNIPIIGKTCGDYEVKGRGRQIEHWIVKHDTDNTLDRISAYVILDDERHDFEDSNIFKCCKNISKHFVHTDLCRGLTNYDVKQAIKILNQKFYISK